MKKILDRIDGYQKQMDALVKDANTLEGTTNKLGKIEAAKVALKVFDIRKKASVFHQKINLDKTEINHLNQTSSFAKQQDLQKIRAEKNHSEEEALSERDAEIAKIDSEFSIEKERAVAAQQLAASHQSDAKKIESAVQMAVEAALDEQNKLYQQQQEQAKKERLAEQKET